MECRRFDRMLVQDAAGSAVHTLEWGRPERVHPHTLRHWVPYRMLGREGAMNLRGEFGGAALVSADDRARVRASGMRSGRVVLDHPSTD